MTQQILVPLDGAPEAERALEAALQVLAPGGSVHLLHVTPVPSLPVGAPPLEGLHLEKPAHAYLEDARRRHLGETPGLNMVRSGEPPDAILQTALEKNIDLISMATHARSGVAHWFLGSIAEEVVRKTQLPVLLTPPLATWTRASVRRIVVALDGTKHSLAILDTVRPMALRTGAEVVLLHVSPKQLDPAPQWAVQGSLATREQPTHRFQDLADRLEKEDPNLVVFPLVVWGDAVEEILSQARLQSADLLALTTHAREGFDRTVLGSVTEEVLRKATCPVLVQKPLVRKGGVHE